MKKLLFLVLASVSLISCDNDSEEVIAGVFKGEEATFQHGKAWTWTEIDNAGKPVKIGISINAQAMATLDTATGGGHNHANSLSLDFAQRTAELPFKHAMIDWNPGGHEPAGLYDVAHFDFHFYLSSEAERLAIPVYEQDSVKFKNIPAAAYMPATYIPIPGGVPQMGTHWIDFTSGEFNGQGFTQTFLYGSYNGKVNFYEPMITRTFIESNGSFERAIPVPAKFQQTGYYPTKMKISKVNETVQVTLEQFVYRTAS